MNPFPTLSGKLIEAGTLKDSNGDTVHGLLIDCGMETLRDRPKIPLYETVYIEQVPSPDAIPGTPTRCSYTLAEIDAKARAWLVELYNTAPRDLPHEQREALHRDLGLLTRFIHDHFPSEP